MIDTPGPMRLVDRDGNELDHTRWGRMMCDLGVGHRIAETTVPTGWTDVLVRTMFTGLDDRVTGGQGLGPYVTVRAPLGRLFTVLQSYDTEPEARAGHTVWVVRAAPVLNS